MAHRTLLYIDDSTADRALLVKAFEMLGSRFQVLPVDDAESGLQAARLYQPAAVLLDLNMPITGEDVLAALKRDALTAKIPVVVLTGEDNPSRAMELRRLGAAEYVVKPGDLGELVRAVEAAVERHLG